MAIGTVMNAPVNTTNYTAQRPATTTDTTPANLGDRFTPSSGNEPQALKLKDFQNAVRADASTAVSREKLPPAQQRSLFVQDMATAGIKASNPPTPEQLKEYMGKFNNPNDREKALDAVQNYSQAFHVHTADTDSGDQDVRYSQDKLQFGFNRQVYKTLKEANAAPAGRDKDEQIQDIQTYDASSWKDVQSRPKSGDGRSIQDCEGFAFMHQELLKAAGYETKQVATQGDQGYAHAMVLARDPDSGKYAVGSNAEIVPATNNNDPDAALQHAWNRATAYKNQGHGDYYYGQTQSEAQGRMAARAR